MRSSDMGVTYRDELVKSIVGPALVDGVYKLEATKLRQLIDMLISPIGGGCVHGRGSSYHGGCSECSQALWKVGCPDVYPATTFCEHEG